MTVRHPLSTTGKLALTAAMLAALLGGCKNRNADQPANPQAPATAPDNGTTPATTPPATTSPAGTPNSTSPATTQPGATPQGTTPAAEPASQGGTTPPANK
jgi:hypothetical protein